MKAATELIVSLSTVFGAVFLALALAGARFAYRKSKRSRSVPVDRHYEETKVTLVDGNTTGDDKGGVGEAGERWFGGSYGLTPVASAGPGGTAQYLGGWWGLDAPSNTGWPRAPASDGNTAADCPTVGSIRSSSSTGGVRESHFSRASRASRRTVKAAHSAPTSSSKAEGRNDKEKKKKPRVSKTSEFGLFERDAGVEGEEADDAKKLMQ
ncbi:hypothetical protein DMC30DRAFT_413039 [Rhodotorula diobovata]|uniref:Uncharacterized protein n=1 Tax=Rhodotorula diobovata TaxID=5288 RepID=A0A5C5G6X6_9BASI|nr:hypothetical protein DMC30DRAFT_413039 [Rhodotorula diobovata]